MQALILAGGSGTRFWPLSRRHRPKQLLALEGERSLLQSTVDRLLPRLPPSAIWVCTTRALADKVGAQLPEVPADQILAEPEGRNTAAAIGWSLHRMPAAARQGAVAVLPADHRFGDAEAFLTTVETAAEVAERDDRVVALGVVPRWPESGYGYLELGDEIDRASGLRQVARFTEKPDPATAAAYVDGGKHWWNAGIFIFRGSVLLAELARFEPELGRGLDDIARQPQRTDEIYSRLPSISIDCAVMEHLDSIAALPLDCGWSDLGSWQALFEVLAADDAGNRRHGDVLAVDAKDNLLWADRGVVTVVGVDNLAVIRTGDAVLVLPLERSQEARRIVEELRKRGRTELL